VEAVGEAGEVDDGTLLRKSGGWQNEGGKTNNGYSGGGVGVCMRTALYD